MNKNYRVSEKRTNLIYEPIERYKKCAYNKLFTIEYGIKDLLVRIFENPNNIPKFNAYIVIRQKYGESFVFKKSKTGLECECNHFIIETEEAFPVGYDISYNPNESYTIFEKIYNTTYMDKSVNPMFDKLCLYLDVNKENLFIHTIYPNYKDKNIPDIEYLCYLVIETEDYMKYQNITSFYVAFAFLYEDSIVFDHNYSLPTVDEIIDNAVKNVYVGINFFPKVEYSNLPYFTTITRLSSLLYEGSKCRSKIIIEDDNHCSPDISFAKHYAFNNENLRAVRKLLEIVNKVDENSENNQALLVKKYLNQGDIFTQYEVMGIVSVDKYPDSPTFVIDENLSWHFVYKQKTLLRYVKGRYIVRKSEEYDKDLLKRTLSKTFSEAQAENISKVISYAWKQKHGTTVLITDDQTKHDIIRLCTLNRGYEINNIDLLANTDYTEMLSSIDGALAIGTDCHCYAIGVILDGESVVPGNMARGARYNSARNYIAILAKQNMRAIAVVISEDRTMDIISTEDLKNECAEELEEV